MYQEDYLLRQINQLARALGKLLFDFMGIKNSGKIEEFYQTANETLKAEIDYNLSELLHIPNDQFVTTLIRKEGFNHTNLNTLADLFFEMGLQLSEIDAFKYFEKALTLYLYLENHDSTYSFERREKIESILNKLTKKWNADTTDAKA